MAIVILFFIILLVARLFPKIGLPLSLLYFLFFAFMVCTCNFIKYGLSSTVFLFSIKFCEPICCILGRKIQFRAANRYDPRWIYTQFFLFFFFLTVKKPQNEKKVKKRSSEVSPLIFRLRGWSRYLQFLQFWGRMAKISISSPQNGRQKRKKKEREREREITAVEEWTLES